MSTISKQRKPYSLEKLNNLRENVREAFEASRGEELQTPNNKNSVYYSDLKNDILLKTKNIISEGTLLKFFHDDVNRSYQLITILTIEEYVSKSLSYTKSEAIEENAKQFANRIYIELKTRKAAIPIDENNDIIEEIYNSWYKLFCVIRDDLKTLPVSDLKDIDNSESVMSLTIKILNEILRPHLTEHQSKFRSWLEKAKQNPEYKNITLQELQKEYPDYKALMKSLKETNQMLIDSAKKLCEMMK